MTHLPRPSEDLAKVLTYLLCHRPMNSAWSWTRRASSRKAAPAGPGRGEGLAHVRRHDLEQLTGLMSPPCFAMTADKIRGLVPGPAQLRRPGEDPPALLYLAITPKSHQRVFEAGLKAPLDAS